MAPTTMKAWQYDSVAGGLEKNLKINDTAAQPAIGDDEILVEVHAMALNPVDYKVTEWPAPETLRVQMYTWSRLLWQSR